MSHARATQWTAAPRLLLLLGVACTSRVSTGRNPSPASTLSLDTRSPERGVLEGPFMTYRIQSVEDLHGSLQQALWNFERANRGARSTFLVEISPGVYRSGDTTISLQTVEDSDVTIVVFCDGPVPAHIHGGGIHIAAAAVTVRNLVFDDAWGSDALVHIQFQTRVTLDRIAIIGGLVSANDAEESLISLAGPGHVTVKDSWFVGNRSRWESEAVFRLPLVGSNAETTTIDVENVVFAGNESQCSFHSGWADARLQTVMFYEPKVSHSLICLAHPPHALSIEGGLFSAGPKAIDYRVSPHLQRSEYRTVTMTGTTVRLPAPIPPEDAIQRDVRYEPSHVPPSLDAVMAAARRGGKPNITELGL